MSSSPHIDDIIDNRDGSVNVQVVFVDIVSYSQRKSTVQRRVIDNFSGLLQESLDYIAANNIAYLQANNLNFKTDVITIATGDGAAIVFSFDGLPALGLEFAKTLIEKSVHARQADSCERFTKEFWCNCHPYFSVRIGMNEGKAIFYRDINGNYNVAGSAINLSSRIMNLADGDQILVSDIAFENLIDLSDDNTLDELFKLYENIPVKHQVKLNIYQFVDEDSDISCIQPRQLSEHQYYLKMRSVTGMPDLDSMSRDDRLEYINKISEAFSVAQSFQKLISPSQHE